MMVGISLPGTMDQIPLSVLTDSYKACHPALYPAAKSRTAYAEFRRPFGGDADDDHRILVYGLRYIIERYVARRWTMEDLDQGSRFYSTHNAGFNPYPFPRALLEKIVTECDGWFPVRITGLREGEVVYPHTPIYTITATEEFAGLVTWLETLLTMVWYPSTVATLSRRIKTLIEEAFAKSVDPHRTHLIESRLHDFGFRGCTSVEQAVIGGSAHLLNFRGSDTAVAAWHVQFNLNGGRPVAQSIPATEHSVMMAHRDEREALVRAIAEYGDGAVSCVIDSYDYVRALQELLPLIAQQKLNKGGFLVVRPDSGDPLETVLLALQALERVFGCEENAKGYRVLRGCGVIQGDGVGYEQIRRILDGIMDAGYSAENVAFGMGGALLQRVNRDAMSFATKLSHIVEADGRIREVCKSPKADLSKASLPGLFSVRRSHGGSPMVYPADARRDLGDDDDDGETEELLQVYFDHGPVQASHLSRSFDAIRDYAVRNWEAMPPIGNPLSPQMQSRLKGLGRGLTVEDDAGP